jgi:hypothetical protein
MPQKLQQCRPVNPLFSAGYIEQTGLHTAFQSLGDLRRRDEEARGQFLRRKIWLVLDSEFE